MVFDTELPVSETSDTQTHNKRSSHQQNKYKADNSNSSSHKPEDNMLKNILIPLQKNSIAILILFTFQLFPILDSHAENSTNLDDEVLLLQGETYKVPAKDRIWVENKEILEVSDLKSVYSIKGKKPGRSFVRVGRQIYQFSILSAAQEKTFRVLNRVIPQTLGLRLTTEKGELLVIGKLHRWNDWQKIADACEKQNCLYQMSAEISTELVNNCEENLNQNLVDQSLPIQKFHLLKPLQISLFKKSIHSERLQAFLQAYGFKIHWVEDALQTSPLVRVHITLAEVKREEFVELGFEWQPMMQGQVLPKSEGSIEKLYAKLKALEQNGSSRTLASPNILCKSGKEAEFFAGGELPIRIISQKTKEIIWKKYGIQMKVKPEADYSGRMSIALETEVSSLDQANALDGIPAVVSNQLKSHFDLNESKVIVLSGLIKNDEGSSQEGLPGLSRLPILGPLFSSQNFRNRQSELLVFVKPEIVKE
jgi:pilus assembly protein CpaC